MTFYPGNRPQLPRAEPPARATMDVKASVAQVGVEIDARVLAQRDEARLRVNLIALCVGESPVYPVLPQHEHLWTMLKEALAPK